MSLRHDPLETLERAGGELALVALASVDFAFSESTPAKRNEIKIALIAASVPHWFNVRILAKLLLASEKKAASLVQMLQKLSLVEKFPSRGEQTFNVHSEFRSAIRTYLRRNSPEQSELFARRAAHTFSNSKRSIDKIEQLHHIFSYDFERAPDLARNLDRRLVMEGKSDDRFLLSAGMKELIKEGNLSGRANIEANLICLSYDGYRSIRQEPALSIELLLKEAREIGYYYGMERALVLLGDAQRESGKSEAAGASFYEAFAIAEIEYGKQRDLEHWGYRLGVTSLRVAQLEKSLGNIDKAIEAARKYLAVAMSPSLRGAAENIFQRRRIALANIQLGSALEAKGDNAEARPYFQTGLALVETLSAEDPDNIDLLRDLSVAYGRAAGLEETDGNIKVAKDLFQKDLDISRRLVSRDGGNLRWKHDLALSLARVGEISESLKEWETARGAYQERLSIIESLLKENPSNQDWQRSLSSVWRAFARVYTALNEIDEAILAGNRACDEARRLAALDSTSGIAFREIAVSCRQLGDTLTIASKTEAALYAYSEYLDAASDAVALKDERKENPPADWVRSKAVAHAAVASVLLKLGRSEQSQEHGACAVSAMERAVNLSPFKKAWVEELDSYRRGEFD